MYFLGLKTENLKTELKIKSHFLNDFFFIIKRQKLFAIYSIAGCIFEFREVMFLLFSKCFWKTAKIRKNKPLKTLYMCKHPTICFAKFKTTFKM